MDKRYQIFVSSTYADLQEERKAVIQTLMEMDCIPSGMELFPAIDEEQFQFIKRVIDDCDYYLLIIGGRYGTLSKEGISYTEKEYDYAIKKGLKVIAFVHKNPGKIESSKTDKDPEIIEKLEKFKEKVLEGKLVKFWEKTQELPGMVALSLQKTIKTFPAIGWVRADTVSNVESLQEINLLRKENQELLKNLELLQSKPSYDIQDAADLDEEIEVGLQYTFASKRWDLKATYSWRKIFALLSPYLLHPLNQITVNSYLARDILKDQDKNGYSASMNDQDFNTLAIQFKSLGLIQVESYKTKAGVMDLFWVLTPEGEKMMMETRVVRTKKGKK